ncbi:hypothetical protein D3C83_195590 [compost metagenome]
MIAKPFPPDVMAELKKHALAVVAELAASDPLAKRIADSYAAFAASARAYTDTAELAYLNAR